MGGSVIHEPDAKDVVNEAPVKHEVGFSLGEDSSFLKGREDG